MGKENVCSVIKLYAKKSKLKFIYADKNPIWMLIMINRNYLSIFEK
jgi:hypothetical protein